MRKRVLVYMVAIVSLFVSAVFFACTLVNNKEETILLRPTVEEAEGNGVYSITAPVQKGMKYATFYRVSSRESKTLTGKDVTKELVAQCFVEDSKLTEESLGIIQIFDKFTDQDIPYYGYYVRYSAGSSIVTATSDAKAGLGKGECRLSEANGEKPTMLFHYDLGRNIAEMVLKSDIKFPQDILDKPSLQLCFVIEKTTGGKEAKLISFGASPKKASEDSENSKFDIVEAGKEGDISIGLPDDFYGTPLKFKGVVGMYVDEVKSGNVVAYKRNYWTDILECDLKILGLKMDGDYEKAEYDGETIIKDNIFSIPIPASKDSIDYY